MKNKRIKLVVLCAILCFPTLASAEWSKQLEVKYVMGDGDNRATARKAAMEMLRQKASNEAGTYVQKTTRLNEDGSLSESILAISASLIRITSPKESLSVNDSGQAVLQVDADVSLDDDELRHRIEELHQDQEKAGEIKRLQAENKLLRGNLDAIHAELATEDDPAKARALLEQQDRLLLQIEQNGQSVSQVFAPGTLLQMADQDAEDFDHARTVLDEKVYGSILSTPVMARLISVEATGNGYEANVRLGWKFNISQISPAFSQYLNVETYDGKIVAFANQNIDNKGKSPLSERVYRYMASNGIDLKLSIGDKTVYLPVFYSDNSLFEPCGLYTKVRDGEQKYLCLIPQAYNSAQAKGMGGVISNPVKIHLTKTQAQNASSVEAEFVRTGQSAPQRQ